MSKRETDLPMTKEDIEQLREVYELCGSSLVEAAKALGINRDALMRAMAGLPVIAMTASYVRLSLPRTLQKLRRTQRVQRTG